MILGLPFCLKREPLSPGTKPIQMQPAYDGNPETGTARAQIIAADIALPTPTFPKNHEFL